MPTTTYEIIRPKQPNGLYGTGIEVQKIDSILIFDTDYKTEVCSAITAMVCEKYPKRSYEVIWVDNTGFTIHFLDSSSVWSKPDKNTFSFYKFNFKNWELQGNSSVSL